MMYSSTQRSSPLCTAVLGSMTMALKAQRALANEAIRSTTIKVGGSSARGGCVYGVEFDCALMGNVKFALDGAGVAVKEFLR